MLFGSATVYEACAAAVDEGNVVAVASCRGLAAAASGTGAALAGV